MTARDRFPGVVLIDPREKAPFPFTDLPLEVTTKSLYLATGDYSLEGLTDRIAIERKSYDDLVATFSDQDRRRRFSAELVRMDVMLTAAVVFETLYDQFCASAPMWVWHCFCQARNNHRRVAWRFCDGRRAAEIETYSILLKFAEEHRG